MNAAIVAWGWIFNLAWIAVTLKVLRGVEWKQFFRGPLFAAKYARVVEVWSFGLMYLTTMLLYRIAMFWQAWNYSGTDGIFDPWNPAIDWVPAFKGWLWLFAIVGTGFALIAQAVSFPFGVRRVASVIARWVFAVGLFLISVFGSQWNTFNTAAVHDEPEQAQEETADGAGRTCNWIAKDYGEQWTARQTLFDAQRAGGTVSAAKSEEVGDRVDALYNEYRTKPSCQEPPVWVGINGTPVIDGQHIRIEAVATGRYLKFVWNPHDPDCGDDVSTQEPLSPCLKDAKLSFTPSSEGNQQNISVLELTYSGPGIYSVDVAVSSDLGGGSFSDSLSVDIGGVSTPTTVTVVSAPPPDCSATWAFTPIDHPNGDLFPGGVASIQAASSGLDAYNAANDWIDRAKTDPINLSGVIKFLNGKDVDPNSLIDANGVCATPEAGAYVDQAHQLVSRATSVTAGDVPANWHNSGVRDGRVVSEEAAGITGDLKGIKLVLEGGRELHVLGRCGNPVTPQVYQL